MNDLINYIDCQIAECLGRGKFYGLSRLILDDKGPQYPICEATNEKIVPFDKQPIMSYHRLLNGSGADSEVYSFGRYASKQLTQNIRMVVLIDIKEPRELIDKFIDALPDGIEDSNYRFAEVNNSVSLIVDSQSIWETEWGNAYKDKYQMRYNIYALEYAVDYIKCPACVTANQNA